MRIRSSQAAPPRLPSAKATGRADVAGVQAQRADGRAKAASKGTAPAQRTVETRTYDGRAQRIEPLGFDLRHQLAMYRYHAHAHDADPSALLSFIDTYI